MTANQLITRALGIINQTDPGETPTAQEIEDGVDFLNAMMDSWRLERLMVYQVKQLSIAWGATIQTKTIGTTGDIVATRVVVGEILGRPSIANTILDRASGKPKLIVGFEGDAAWPRPVWGVGTAEPYNAEAIHTVIASLTDAFHKAA